jgi:hypothetical protein
MEASERGTRERVVENVQQAIEDLRGAGEKATGDVRSGIDSAIQRLREASGEAGSRAQDQVGEWRSTLERASEDVRRELGKLAVRTQGSLDSLDEIEQELNERRRALGGEPAGPAAST